jgi:nucleoside 2-deoxyribosyltransferase
MDIENRRFVSPKPHGTDDEFLIAERMMDDGWIKSRISFPEEGEREAGLLFRWRGENEAYLAGIGGWNHKLIVAKMNLRKEWDLLKGVGKTRDLAGGASFLLEVRFSGPKIQLFVDGVEQLTAVDRKYASGRVGLYASRSQVTFSDVQVSAKKCFVVMPFKPSFKKVYLEIRKAVEAKGLDCVRSDEIKKDRPIMADVIEQIRTADLVIVDLTDQNANVYYEAGLAHALGKECIILAESDREVAFNLRNRRVVFYGNRESPDNLGGLLEEWIDAALVHY